MATVPCVAPDLHTPEEDRHFYRDTVFPNCAILGALLPGAVKAEMDEIQLWTFQANTVARRFLRAPRLRGGEMHLG